MRTKKEEVERFCKEKKKDKDRRAKKSRRRHSNFLLKSFSFSVLLPASITMLSVRFS